MVKEQVLVWYMSSISLTLSDNFCSDKSTNAECLIVDDHTFPFTAAEPVVGFNSLLQNPISSFHRFFLTESPLPKCAQDRNIANQAFAMV